jgi:hypothetical protein
LVHGVLIDAEGSHAHRSTRAVIDAVAPAVVTLSTSLTRTYGGSSAVDTVRESAAATLYSDEPRWPFHQRLKTEGREHDAAGLFLAGT